LVLSEVHSPPFELTETGWGEFEAGIRVFFRDADEQVHLRSYIYTYMHNVHIRKWCHGVLMVMMCGHVAVVALMSLSPYNNCNCNCNCCSQPLDLTHTILLYHPEAAPAQTKTVSRN
jgi:hypothetical protein